jgi:hypothetical protein
MSIQVLSALIGALVAGIVTTVGWFANYYLSRKSETKTHRMETSQQHLERQIEELYGPLWGLIQQSEAVYAVACQRLPSINSKINQAEFNEQESEIWSYLKDTFFLPINFQIAELLRTKVYLIESGELPASFKDFLIHQAQFEVLHRLWKDKEIDSTQVRGTGWPSLFNQDVAQSLGKLRKQYREQLLQTGSSSQKAA